MKQKYSFFRISRRWKPLKKHLRFFGILFSLVVFSSLFFLISGITPNSSELVYTEYSSLGEEAGTVVPASCDGSGGTPGSHFRGDCTATCPSGTTGTYDPYFDPGHTACVSSCLDWTDADCTAIGWDYVTNACLGYCGCGVGKTYSPDPDGDGRGGTCQASAPTCNYTDTTCGAGNTGQVATSDGCNCVCPSGTTWELYYDGSDEVYGCVSNTTPTYSCTGSVPLNAGLYSGDDSGLSANTSSVFSWVNSNRKCEYNCNTGYSWNGSSCVANAYSCTGTIPANASMYAGDDTPLSSNTPYTYWATDTGTKCQYSCNSGYTWDGSSCIADATTYSCTGSVPANASMYAGDDVGLSANTPYSRWSSDTGTQCQYGCNAGYDWDGSSCVAPSPPSPALTLCPAAGATIYAGNTFSFAAWYNASGTTDCASTGTSTNVTSDPSTSWSTDNSSRATVGGGIVTGVAPTPPSTPVHVSASYGGLSKSVPITVLASCVTGCTSAQSANICTGQTYSATNSCGQAETCNGSRSCNFNWQEIAP